MNRDEAVKLLIDFAKEQAALGTTPYALGAPAGMLFVDGAPQTPEQCVNHYVSETHWFVFHNTPQDILDSFAWYMRNVA